MVLIYPLALWRRLRLQSTSIYSNTVWRISSQVTKRSPWVSLHLQAQAVEETFITDTVTAVALAAHGADNLLFCHKILMYSNSAGRRDLNAI